MIAPPKRGGVGVGARPCFLINCAGAAGPSGGGGAPDGLAGFRLGDLPPGLTPLGADSEYTSSVNVDGLTGEPPEPADPQTTVSMRIYVRGSAGMALAVSVLHPDNAAQTQDWLLGWATRNAHDVGAFLTAAGPARIFTQDSNSTIYRTVIIADGSRTGNALILIEGPATSDVQVAFAQGIVPQ